MGEREEGEDGEGEEEGACDEGWKPPPLPPDLGTTEFELLCDETATCCAAYSRCAITATDPVSPSAPASIQVVVEETSLRPASRRLLAA